MKILIVDDDARIRQFVAGLPEWAEIGCEVAGQAADGLAALSLMESVRPDLLITDIRMPRMDGLELVAKVKESYPETAVILLTAYDEFDYAKRAIKLGVSDFITKPFLPEELIDSARYILRNLARTVEADTIVQEELIYCLTDATRTNHDKYQMLEQSGFTDRPVVLMSIEIDNVKLLNQMGRPFSKLALKGKVLNVLAGEGLGYWHTLSQEGLHLVLFQHDHGHGAGNEEVADLGELAFRSARLILEAAKLSFAYSISLGISQVLSSPVYLHNGMEQIQKCFEYRFLLGKGSIISFDALSKMETMTISGMSPNLHKLRQAIISGESASLSEFMRESYKHILKDGLSKRQVQVLAEGMIDYAITVANEASITLLPEEINEMRNPFRQFTILSDLMRYVEEQLQSILKRVSVYLEENSLQLIVQVKAYIREYYRQDISLQSLAEYLFMNYSYLSRAIKQKTGQTFRDMLWQYRVEVAKSILAFDESKVYEVAYAVGFKDPAHFSRLFKELTGMTPVEFKSKNQRD